MKDLENKTIELTRDEQILLLGILAERKKHSEETMSLYGKDMRESERVLNLETIISKILATPMYKTR